MTRSPIFVIGFARSGTTLLRAVLGQHPAISMFNEPELVAALSKAGFHPGRSLTGTARVAAFDHLFAADSRAARHLLATAPETVMALRQTDPLGFREAYEALLPVAAADGAVWGEKSMSNIFFVDTIAELYENAAFIFIRRDPRAVVLSKFRKARRDAEAQVAGSLRTIASVAPYFAAQARLWAHWDEVAEGARARHRSHWLDITYERFVFDPETEIRRICDFLGLDFEPAMLESAGRVADPVLASRSAYAHGALAGEINTRRAEAHKELAPSLSALVLGVTGYEAEEARRPSALESACVGISLFLRRRRIERQVDRRLAPWRPEAA